MKLIRFLLSLLILGCLIVLPARANELEMDIMGQGYGPYLKERFEATKSLDLSEFEREQFLSTLDLIKGASLVSLSARAYEPTPLHRYEVILAKQEDKDKGRAYNTFGMLIYGKHEGELIPFTFSFGDFSKNYLDNLSNLAPLFEEYDIDEGLQEATERAIEATLKSKDFASFVEFDKGLADKVAAPPKFVRKHIEYLDSTAVDHLNTLFKQIQFTEDVGYLGSWSILDELFCSVYYLENSVLPAVLQVNFMLVEGKPVILENEIKLGAEALENLRRYRSFDPKDKTTRSDASEKLVERLRVEGLTSYLKEVLKNDESLKLMIGPQSLTVLSNGIASLEGKELEHVSAAVTKPTPVLRHELIIAEFKDSAHLIALSFGKTEQKSQLYGINIQSLPGKINDTVSRNAVALPPVEIEKALVERAKAAIESLSSETSYLPFIEFEEHLAESASTLPSYVKKRLEDNWKNLGTYSKAIKELPKVKDVKYLGSWAITNNAFHTVFTFRSSFAPGIVAFQFYRDRDGNPFVINSTSLYGMSAIPYLLEMRELDEQAFEIGN